MTDPLDAVSLGLALMLGLLGLPHILMRFTVPDARAARVRALRHRVHRVFLSHHPDRRFRRIRARRPRAHREGRCRRQHGGPLAAELLGGTPFLGFIAAVAFATILAVVAGLTLAGASALSTSSCTSCAAASADHEQVRVARAATVVFGALAVLLGVVFKGQNVAFMVGLAFAIACSANFPPLHCSRSCGSASQPQAPSARS